jgi:hypothetical protein
MRYFMSQGIVQSKEAIVALIVLGKFVAERAKDGLDLSDAVELVKKFVMDEEFKGVLEAGVKGLDAIPSELSDIELQEAVELIGLIVGALKK